MTLIIYKITLMGSFSTFKVKQFYSSSFYIYFCNMKTPLTDQEIHNLAMNFVGEELEERGFEFGHFSAVKVFRLGRQHVTSKHPQILPQAYAPGSRHGFGRAHAAIPARREAMTAARFNASIRLVGSALPVPAMS